jgi:methionyl-tRNA synthetase
MRQVGEFYSESNEVLRGQKCIIQTQRGIEVGTVLVATRPVKDPSIRKQQAGKILRVVNQQDTQKIDFIDQRGKSKEARLCEEAIQELDLQIKLSYTEYLFDQQKVVFYIQSEQRVDLRPLTLALKEKIHIQIVIKQIGARDEARLLGDWNDCGRELCCRNHLQHLSNVPMKMAKSQKTTLDPAKISGRCGRLKCCLRYEHDTYVELKQRLPKKGSKVRTRHGMGVVIGTDVLSQMVRVQIQGQPRCLLPATEVLPLEKSNAGKSRSSQLSDQDQKRYITIPFSNLDSPITFTTAHAAVAADSYYRHQKSLGHSPHYLAGIKDHSRSTQQISRSDVDEMFSRGDAYRNQFQKQMDLLQIHPDKIFRTKSEVHKKTVTDFFRKLITNNDIYTCRVDGLHCTRCHIAISHDPHPTSVPPSQCPDCQGELEPIHEDPYFFRLKKFEKLILRHIQNHSDFIKPQFLKIELENRIKSGLKDVIVSRPTFEYGIPIPGETDQIIAGWFEGLIGYISALADSENNQRFLDYWPAHIQMVQSETVWMHAVAWPAMLLAGEVSLPERIFVTGDWNVDIDSDHPSLPASTSPCEIAEIFGSDSVRYFLLSHVPFGMNAVFQVSEFHKSIQRNLIHDLDGLTQRTLSLTQKVFHGTIPDPEGYDGDPEIRSLGEQLCKDIRENIATLQFSRILDEFGHTVRSLRYLLEENKPWTWPQKGPEGLPARKFFYSLLESLRILAHQIGPFLPTTSARMLTLLGISPESELSPSDEKWGQLEVGKTLPPPSPLFPEFESAKFDTQSSSNNPLRKSS